MSAGAFLITLIDEEWTVTRFDTSEEAQAAWDNTKAADEDDAWLVQNADDLEEMSVGELVGLHNAIADKKTKVFKSVPEGAQIVWGILFTAAENDSITDATPENEGAEASQDDEERTVAKAKTEAKTEGKTSAKKAASNGADESKRRGRSSSLDPSAKITILAETNPRRAGSNRAARFEKYKKNMTVQQALDAGIKPVGIHTDVKEGIIQVG